MNLNIKYNTSLRTNVFAFGTVSLTAFLLAFIFSHKFSIYFYIGLIIYLFIEIYKIKTNYITVKDGYIMKNFGGKLKLAEIRRVIRYADEFVLESDKKSMSINLEKVKKTSLKDLDFFMQELTDKI